MWLLHVIQEECLREKWDIHMYVYMYIHVINLQIKTKMHIFIIIKLYMHIYGQGWYVSSYKMENNFILERFSFIFNPLGYNNKRTKLYLKANIYLQQFSGQHEKSVSFTEQKTELDCHRCRTYCNV